MLVTKGKKILQAATPGITLERASAIPTTIRSDMFQDCVVIICPTPAAIVCDSLVSRDATARAAPVPEIEKIILLL